MAKETIEADVTEARNKLLERILIATNTGDGVLSKKDRHDLLIFMRETTAEVFGDRHEANEVLLHHCSHEPNHPTHLRRVMEDREFRRQFVYAWLDHS